MFRKAFEYDPVAVCYGRHMVSRGSFVLSMCFSGDLAFAGDECPREIDAWNSMG